MNSITIRLPVFAANSKMERYRLRANDKDTSPKRKIKYLLKMLNIASKHAFMGYQNVKEHFMVLCYQSLCLLYHKRDKLEKAIYFNNKIITKYLRTEKEYGQYYRYKFILALVFGNHNAIKQVIESLRQSNFDTKHLWYYTYQLIYSTMRTQYAKAVVCRHRAISVYNASITSMRSAFEIWGLYLTICMNQLNKENENTLNEIMTSIRREQIELTDLSIMGLVYIAVHSTECNLHVSKGLLENVWLCLLDIPHALAEYHISRICFAEKEFILSYIKMKRAIKRTPELPIIKQNGQDWIDKLENVLTNFRCKGCGVKNNTNEIVLRPCTGCANALYCSRKCQKRDWKYKHRLICKGRVYVVY
eukprot:UN01074